MVPQHQELPLEHPYTVNVILDIAVGLMILRPSFWYFILTSATGVAVHAAIKQTALYNLRSATAELAGYSAIIMCIALYAAVITAWFEIPKRPWMRLSVGFTALALTLVADFGRRLFESKDIVGSYLSTSSETAGIALLFGLMPWLLSFLERDAPKPRYTFIGDADRFTDMKERV